MGSYELSERSSRLLATLVREYIETGEPVSSQVLARESGLHVSSATVRNVLAHLEAATSISHIPRRGACRRTVATGCLLTFCLKAVARPAAQPTSSISSVSTPVVPR